MNRYVRARRHMPAAASVKPAANNSHESGSGVVVVACGTATEELSCAVVPASEPTLLVDWLVKWPSRLIPASDDVIVKPEKLAGPVTTGPAYMNVTFMIVGLSNDVPLMVEGVIPINCDVSVQPGVETEAETNPGIS